ncbi:lycopene cyclase family protein [Streptomyces sp. NPDC006464]|uniref:lycopene cyclase family protein n=1 Tax=Streptomyces sp. NPDC006464 TaxID=3154305 RepID=UPI0033AE7600
MTSTCSDVVIVGAGAAGLSLAWRLLNPPAGVVVPRVTLVDAPVGPLRPPERTWCYWERGPGEYDDLLTASWGALRVRDSQGSGPVRGMGAYRYKMLRSPDFTSGLLPRLGGLTHIDAVVTDIDDLDEGAELTCRTPDGAPLSLRARWVFDSRPPRTVSSRVALLQHFRGWFLRTHQPVLHPHVVELMDFRTPQPRLGLSFGYVLPTGPREALVEYTEFSPSALHAPAYDAALRHYTDEILRLGRFDILGTEQGVIPMTDAHHQRRAGRHVFRIGAAGGAVRPSTGYAFTAIQRQTRAVADALHHGRLPVPPPAYPPRHLSMDATLLRGLCSGRIPGAPFFSRLFRDVSTERLLRFLDGDTRPAEDLLIGLRTPILPMLRTAAELPLLSRTPH